MAKNRREFLFWTKVPDPRQAGALVTVKVYVDLDRAIEIAKRAAANKGRRSSLGPIIAEALSGNIDLTRYSGPEETI